MKLAVRFEEQEQRLDCDFGEVHEIADAEGYGKGYNDGKKDGYAEGYGEGETAGRAEGFEDGKQAGYEEGYQAGEDAGYDKGYEDGATESPAAMQLDALIDGSITEISTNVGKLREYAFYFHNNLATVNLPVAASIGTYAFAYCATLATANCPAAASVGNSAFYACASLATLNIQSATSIGNYAFYSCSKLKDLILRAPSVCKLSNVNAFNATPIRSGTGYIYVPAALIDSYKTATNWATYANQFRAIEDYTVDGTLNGEMDWEKMGVAA